MSIEAVSDKPAYSDRAVVNWSKDSTHRADNKDWFLLQSRRAQAPNSLPAMDIIEAASLKPLTKPGDSNQPATESSDRSTASPEQRGNESRLNGRDQQTNNLLVHSFDFEQHDQMKVDPRVELSTGKSEDGGPDIKINVRDRINQGDKLSFSQPIDYTFHDATPLQQQFKKDHPNLDLGHLVQVEAKIKASGDNALALQIMGSQPPYKQSMNERIDLGSADQPKGKDGFATYTFYAVVPSTEKPGDLSFKINMGREQGPGQIEIKDLSVREVTDSPSVHPAEVVKRYEQDLPAGPADSAKSQFMLGVIGNKLVNSTFKESDHELDDMVKQAKEQYPDNQSKQIESVQKAEAAWSKTHESSPEEKEQYVKLMHDMGANTLTVPIYWSMFEKEKGKLDYSQVDQVVALAEKYDMKVKLHPIAWAGCYPNWVDQEYDKEKKSNPELTHEDYTKRVLKDHIDKTLAHFGKFGDEIGYVEVNEMNSTDQLQDQKTNVSGRPVLDEKGHPQMKQVDNGLSKWVADAGPAAVINQVNGWIKQGLSNTPGLEHTKVFDNEYFVDQRTQSNDAKVSADQNHPDAFGFQAHQFSSQYLGYNQNDSLLSMALQFGKSHPDGTPTYLSELTVPTNPAPNFDESKMSDAVARARQDAQDYRTAHGIDLLHPDQMKAQEAQAEELRAWFKMAMTSKNVQGISLWNGTDKHAWLGNTGGVLDENGCPKVSYFVLKELIKEYENR